MRILITLSKEELNALEKIKEIREESDIVFCLHELIERFTTKKPETLIRNEDTKIGHITFKKGTKVYKCPTCGEWLTGSQKYCSNCGQAVLRRGEDE